MRLRRLALLLLLSSTAATTAACADGASDDVDDFGIDEELSPVGPMGKEDGAGRPGPRVATNTAATQVWTARNKWEDSGTTAARRAGLAWPADSGLSWDQKYAAWIASLESIDAETGDHDTLRLTTPWGKTLPAPVLECAETAIFLRATFAAWYELPFFMEAVSSGGQRVYFGHFGIRTATGKYASTPSFASAYKDHSATWTTGAAWPSDAKLRARSAAGGSDEQIASLFGPGAHTGAYLDEVHLNKRAGHLIIYLLNYFGSMNLADAANTYNLVPDGIRAGDVLLHRWQRSGIGDTKLLWRVRRDVVAGETRVAVQLASGSMPRRQAKIYDEVASKGYFTSQDTGGPGENEQGDDYWKLGGGAKRWRVTKDIGGYWTNTWAAGDEASWINDQDEARVSARPAQFEALLFEVPPAEKRDALLAQIADARAHLLAYPASCAARERRERAFRDLYDLAPRLGTTAGQLDADVRTMDDYVFAELSYTASKTCCWNSTTAAMADVILDYAESEQSPGTCTAPTVFRATGGGYQPWAALAAATGRAAAWRAWSEDESCPQRNVAEDTVLDGDGTAWCELAGGGGGACTDAHEPNDTSATARAVPATGTLQGRICAADQDFFSVVVSAGGSLSATITFAHAAGDLDLELLSPTGARVDLSDGTSDTEAVSASGLTAGTYRLRVYGYGSAVGEYSLAL